MFIIRLEVNFESEKNYVSGVFVGAYAVEKWKKNALTYKIIICALDQKE